MGGLLKGSSMFLRGARSRPALLAAVAAVAALAACAGSLDDPDGTSSSSSASSSSSTSSSGGPDGGAGLCPQGFDVEKNLFAVTCAGSICHSPGNPALGLDLVSADPASRMIDVASSECSGETLIDSANPDASYLLDKISAAPVCGDPMPLAKPALSAEQIDCVAEWVRSVVP